ncbi:MAG TPA: dTDP-4-dehydrorhamnose reductase [Acidimicrobiales bacterium]|nr:dTDP-4-dehydrorhamnose reductase [Acidimicrobiales bacterium]
MSPPLRVLVTGGNGQLGRDVRDVLAGAVPDGGVLPVERDRGDIEVLSTDIDNLDVVNRTAVGEAFESFRPQVVIHGGAFTAVDACESDPDTAFAVNTLGTRHVAEAARRVGAHLLYVSTDYVFDGTLDRPYVEWDATNPQSVYGRSKLGGELEVAAVSGGESTVVRTAWVSGAHGANMVKTVLRLASATPDGTLRFVDDQHGTPTFTADLATAVVGLALGRRPGTFHVTNQGETTWFGFARATLTAAGLDPDRVEPIATEDLDPPRPAPRPANSRLDNAALRLSGLDLLPEWTTSLARLVEVLPAGAERT